MSAPAATRERQRGVALIIVLFLTATLSFIVLGLVDALALSARRTSGLRDRSEAMWRAVSAEAIAATAIRQALQATSAGGPPLDLAHPLFAQELVIPFEGGVGTLRFADATRCFNINALAGANAGDADDGDSEIDRLSRSALRDEEGGNEDEAGADGEGGAREEALTPTREIGALLRTIGFGASEAERFLNVARDWMDEDDAPLLSGAEDSLYTGLPAPFRTGAAPLGDLSELRAMDGVTREVFGAAAPFLCAYPSEDAVPININVLRRADAPLIAALTNERVSAAEAADAIEERPPGGWDSVEAFWAQPLLQDPERDETQAPPAAARTALSSRFVEARALARVNEIDIEVRLIFMASESGDEITLVSREFGGGA